MKTIKSLLPAFLPLLLLLPSWQMNPALDAEEATWVAMLEEEKLARDVYTYFHDSYNQQIFANIASSENQHMDKVKAVFTGKGYELPASVANDEAGKFTVEAIQKLYDELTTKGDVSLTEALSVGAWIEEKDIFDLNAMIATEEDAEVKQVLGTLLEASHNHIRAFSRQLGGDYIPQILSAEAYNEILGQGNAKGMSHGKGKGQGKAMAGCSGNCGGSCKGGSCKGGGCKGSGSH